MNRKQNLTASENLVGPPLQGKKMTAFSALKEFCDILAPSKKPRLEALEASYKPNLTSPSTPHPQPPLPGCGIIL